MARPLNWRLPALLTLAALAWWLLNERDSSDPAVAALPNELLGEPDLYLEEARIRQFNDAGVLSYELNTKQLRHFQGDAITRMDAPDLVLHSEQDNRPPWLGRADKGFINSQATGGLVASKEPQPITQQQEERVYLNSNVVLEQRFPDGRFTRLRTEHLYLFPDREFVQTEHSVTIDTEVGRTRAAALAADLQRGVINLKADADQRVNTIVLRDQFK